MKVFCVKGGAKLTAKTILKKYNLLFLGVFLFVFILQTTNIFAYETQRIAAEIQYAEKQVGTLNILQKSKRASKTKMKQEYEYSYCSYEALEYEKGKLVIDIPKGFVPEDLNLGGWTNYDGKIKVNTLRNGVKQESYEGELYDHISLKKDTSETTPETSTTEATTEKVSTEATTEKVSTEATTEKVSAEATTEVTTQKANTEVMTESTEAKKTKQTNSRQEKREILDQEFDQIEIIPEDEKIRNFYEVKLSGVVDMTKTKDKISMVANYYGTKEYKEEVFSFRKIETFCRYFEFKSFVAETSKSILSYKDMAKVKIRGLEGSGNTTPTECDINIKIPSGLKAKELAVPSFNGESKIFVNGKERLARDGMLQLEESDCNITIKVYPETSILQQEKELTLTVEANKDENTSEKMEIEVSSICENENMEQKTQQVYFQIEKKTNGESPSNPPIQQPESEQPSNKPSEPSTEQPSNPPTKEPESQTPVTEQPSTEEPVVIPTQKPKEDTKKKERKKEESNKISSKVSSEDTSEDEIKGTVKVEALSDTQSTHYNFDESKPSIIQRDTSTETEKEYEKEEKIEDKKELSEVTNELEKETEKKEHSLKQNVSKTVKENRMVQVGLFLGFVVLLGGGATYFLFREPKEEIQKEAKEESKEE